jgi:hypothetical protein
MNYDAVLALSVYQQQIRQLERENKLVEFTELLHKEANAKAEVIQIKAREEYHRTRDERMRLLLIDSFRSEILTSTNNATDIIDIILLYVAEISPEQHRLIRNNKLVQSKK